MKGFIVIYRKKISDCAGHFGFIRLELPVFHVGFLRHTLSIVQCICKKCSRVLIPQGNDRSSILKRLRRAEGVNAKGEDALSRANIFKKVIDLCKKNTICSYCNYSNGVVKKIGGTFKIVHEKYRAKQPQAIDTAVPEEILAAHPDLRPLSNKPVENLNPIKVYELLCRIPEEDMYLLWMNRDFGRPESLILWNLPVPPVPIRPSVPQDQGGSNEDDITIKLQEIVEMNNALKLALEKGATMKMIMEDWEFLQIQVALLINGETPGIPRQLLGPRILRGLCQRLKGKQGRFRGNLSGKRVDFSGRTVISPDPNLMVDQVGIPEHVAKIMTYPEKVNRYNIHRMKELVINGPEKHPGAMIVRSSDGISTSLLYGDREAIAMKLKPGDTLDRHMSDDDIVLFNRQPSLHKQSIMAHRVRVMPYRTFRFNECACTPYNADFDGDEMNIHFPQTEEAKAEAKELMSITYNLITPRHGVPLVAATQDFLTGAYLLTQRDVFLTKFEFCRLLAYLSDASLAIDLPPPTIYKPLPLWTGKQVISLLVRPNNSYPCHVNLESEEKFYSKADQHFCRNDGYVAFRHGELISGNLGKKTLGGDSKTGLFYVMIRDYGAQEAVECMTRLAKLTSRYLADRGFSIGIDDVMPSPSIVAWKQELVAHGLAQAESIIEQFHQNLIKLKPGCNAIQSLESELNGILSRVREKAGDRALETLPYRNAPLCMATCGSKGSPLNISQMIALLGQQSVSGSRIQDGFIGRSLPHFPVGSLTPQAKGFVANSFFSGLTATEFFFHTMGGREGLVDTAVKTAETGYMARRLMKALEDLSMQYDQTVRNSESMIIQFSYGDDGLNPQMMERDDRPVEYHRILQNVHHQTPATPASQFLYADELIQAMEAELTSHRFQALLPQGYQFLEETRKFFIKMSDRIRIMEAACQQNNGVWSRYLKDDNLALTRAQLLNCLEIAYQKYLHAMIEPGEAVGAVGAQSLSEPGTQMTLKTFHFAGVASMNVTLGVPRLKEIINASKLISTPIIEARILQEDSITAARIIKASIEKTLLGEICEYIREVHGINGSYLEIKLDRATIQNLQLSRVNGFSVRRAIFHNPISSDHKNTNNGDGSSSAASTKVSTIRPAILRSLKEQHVSVTGKYNEKLMIYPPDAKEPTSKVSSAMNQAAVISIGVDRRSLFTLQALKNILPYIIVEGIASVSRAVINVEEKSSQKSYHLLVEGYGLREVIATPGVDAKNSKTNHILETQDVLGIEAARLTIALEIKYIMEAYGIAVDRRHLMLLSDVMTFKGEVLGITRFGVAKMKESVLMLASFEKTTDHLFDAAVHSREDSITGVSECIIMGVPIPIGTGIFKLVHKAHQTIAVKSRKRLLDRQVVVAE
jgi:DNA-directed RNA polymerase III subunit RPC1